MAAKLAVIVGRAFPDAQRREMRRPQRRHVPLVHGVVGNAVDADLAVAPGLRARPLDAVVEVLGLARRPHVEIAGRAAGAARIDAHDRVAVRHPFLRIDQLPVLVLVARALRRSPDRPWSCASRRSCSPPGRRAPWRRAHSSGSPGICRRRPAGTRRRAAPRRRPSRSARPNRSSCRRGFRSFLAAWRATGTGSPAFAGDDGEANIGGWASQRTAGRKSCIQTPPSSASANRAIRAVRSRARPPTPSSATRWWPRSRTPSSTRATSTAWRWRRSRWRPTTPSISPGSSACRCAGCCRTPTAAPRQ